MRILALFIFLITTAEASDLPNIKNIVIHKVPKTYENVFFLNKKNEKIKINDFKGKLLVLNFTIDDYRIYDSFYIFMFSFLYPYLIF